MLWSCGSGGRVAGSAAAQEVEGGFGLGVSGRSLLEVPTAASNPIGRTAFRSGRWPLSVSQTQSQPGQVGVWAHRFYPLPCTRCAVPFGQAEVSWQQNRHGRRSLACICPAVGESSVVERTRRWLGCFFSDCIWLLRMLARIRPRHPQWKTSRGQKHLLLQSTACFYCFALPWRPTVL
jgi:hypothetical protein